MAKQGKATKSENGVLQERIAQAVVILMMCVLPLYLDENRYRGLTGHKYTFFFYSMCAVFSVVLLILISKWVKGAILPRHKLSVEDWALLGFVLITLLSALLSPYAWETDVWGGIAERHDGAITQFFYAAIFFIVAYWYKPRIIDFAIFAITSIVIAIIGILQFYGMDFLKLWPNEVGSEYRVENFYNIHFRSTLGNIDMVSTFVCVAVLLCGFLFVQCSSKKWRYVWFAASALSFWLMELAAADSGRAGVLVTIVLAIPFIIQSRRNIGNFLLLAAGWAGSYTLQKLFYDFMILKAETGGRIAVYVAATVVLTVAGLFLTVFLKDKGESQNAPIKWRRAVAALLTVAIVGFAGVEIVGGHIGKSGNVANPIYQAREILHGNIDDDFGSYRIYIWRNALEAISDYPLIGSGPDTFYEAFPNQQEAKLLHGQPYDKAHNEYLQILVCQGILGLLCYLAFLGALFIKSVRSSFKNPVILAVFMGFIGYCVQAFFNISLPIASQMLWVMAGMLACFARLHKSGDMTRF